MTNDSIVMWGTEDGKMLRVKTNEFGQTIFEIQTVGEVDIPKVTIEKFRSNGLIEFLTKDKT